MEKKAPKKIIYVSCDSATLARDLKILCGDSESGNEKNNTNNASENAKYNLEKFKLVDMFPHTMHVETVCLLTKN